jgi:LysR family transcriptional regulator for bpeEF and oprC
VSEPTEEETLTILPASDLRRSGKAIAPTYIVAAAIEQGKLQAILTNYASKEGTVIAIIYPQKKYLPAKVRVFIDFMMNLKADWKHHGIVD